MPNTFAARFPYEDSGEIKYQDALVFEWAEPGNHPLVEKITDDVLARLSGTCCLCHEPMSSHGKFSADGTHYGLCCPGQYIVKVDGGYSAWFPEVFEGCFETMEKIDKEPFKYLDV